VAQSTNRKLLDSEAQTKKPSRWFWGSNHQTVVTGFEAQTGKPSTTSVLRLNQEIVTIDFEAKPEKPSPPVLRSNQRKSLPPVLRSNQRNRRHRFWGQTGETAATVYEAKPEKTIATGFEVKLKKTVPVVLRSNH
jgi:hypothetical protein